MAQSVDTGSNSSFRIKIDWLETTLSGRTQSAADLTRGQISVWIAGEPVWGPAFEWTWIELLEHLSYCWPYLEWEAAYPMNLRPRTPIDLPKEAEDLSE